jgi:protein-tyrosine phosphatase
MAGISRSVSLVLAYLMKEKGMNYNQAYSIVKKNRKIVSFKLFLDQSEPWIYKTIAKILKITIKIALLKEQIDLII